MGIKASLFRTSDLHKQDWIIPSGTRITEMHVEIANERRVTTAVIGYDVLLDPNYFKVIDPPFQDRIKDHVCFELTTPGQKTWVYVNETDIRLKPTTWVDRKKMNVISSD